MDDGLLIVDPTLPDPCSLPRGSSSRASTRSRGGHGRLASHGETVVFELDAAGRARPCASARTTSTPSTPGSAAPDEDFHEHLTRREVPCTRPISTRHDRRDGLHEGPQRRHHQGVLRAPARRHPFPGMVVLHHAPGWDEWSECTRRSPTTATWRSPRTSTSATATALPRRRGQGARGRAARRTRRSSAISRARTASFARCPTSAARSACSAPAPGAGRRFSPVPVAGLRRRHRLLGRTRGPVQGRADAEPAGGAHRLHEGPLVPAPRALRQRRQGAHPEQVNQHEAELKKHGKQYEFHRYDGAGHGFFYYDRAGLPSGTGHGRLEEGVGVLRANPAIARRRGAQPCAR